jgi:glycosyltransferase involved in cell wall biosynthesis
MLAANAFVFPSYREGFPNAVMQASCLGLPCIVSNINGCSELIEDGKSGWIIPAKSTDALLVAMEDLMADPVIAAHRASVARQYITRHFDRHVFWQALLKEYRQLLE